MPETANLKQRIFEEYLVDKWKPEDTRIKLKPVKNDQTAFGKLFSDPTEHIRESNLTVNYDYFYDRIQKQEITIDQLYDAMEDFIDNVSVLTFGMGHKVFEPLIKKESGVEDISDKEVFSIKTKNNTVDAKMVRTVEGYVVLKGSKIRESDTKSTPSWAKKKRAQLVADGTIKDGIFTRNELFSSPSGASDLVTGNSTSGNKMWKTENGTTLGEILEKEKQD